jgi:broad specificity phosphatase PhoE
MRLVLVRHCEPNWQDPGTDADDRVGLTQRGLSQAEATALELARRLRAGNGTIQVLASPTRRTLETAEILARGCDASVVTDDALALSLMADPHIRKRVMTGVIDTEVFEELTGKADLLWQSAAQLASAEPDGKLVAVSHDLCIAAVVCRALSMPVADFRRFRIDLGSISVIDFRPQRTILASLNETHHLPAATAAGR